MALMTSHWRTWGRKQIRQVPWQREDADDFPADNDKRISLMETRVACGPCIVAISGQETHKTGTGPELSEWLLCQRQLT